MSNQIKNITPDQKYVQYVTINYDSTSTNTYVVQLNNLFPCNKIRISTAATAGVNQSGFLPPLLLTSNVVDNVIGTVMTDIVHEVAPNVYYADEIKPINGIEYFAKNKFYINGPYNVNISNLDKSIVTNNIQLTILIIFEYYSF